MEAISIVALVFGIFGLIAFGEVKKLRKEIVSLRDDLSKTTLAAYRVNAGQCCGTMLEVGPVELW